MTSTIGMNMRIPELQSHTNTSIFTSLSFIPTSIGRTSITDTNI